MSVMIQMKNPPGEPLIDLVFLDIQMPGGSGFDVLERLERVPFGRVHYGVRRVRGARVRGERVRLPDEANSTGTPGFSAGQDAHGADHRARHATRAPPIDRARIPA